MESLSKTLHDTLIIIRHQIYRSVAKEDLEALKRRGLITEKQGGGWIATSSGRDYVRKLK